MKTNIASTTVIAFFLGFSLYHADVATWIVLVWPAILVFQVVTWYFQGKNAFYQEEARRLRMTERKMGVWN